MLEPGKCFLDYITSGGAIQVSSVVGNRLDCFADVTSCLNSASFHNMHVINGCLVRHKKPYSHNRKRVPQVYDVKEHHCEKNG